MKKINIYVIAFIIALLCLCSSAIADDKGNSNKTATKNVIDKGTISIYAGKTRNLNIAQKNIKAVATSNKKVAIISKKAIISAKLAGSCYVSIKNQKNKIYRYKVKVVPYITKKSLTLTKSKQTNLKLVGTSIKAVGSTNKKVAIITKKGVVKAVNGGSCKVRLKGADNKIYECKVKIEAPYLNKKELVICLGDKYDLNLKGTTKLKYWSTNDASVVSINKSGVVSAKKIGTTLVQVKSDGIIYKCNVRVKYRYAKWQNSNVSILGDSISSFTGTTSANYRAYYPLGDVQSKNYMWWNLVFRETKWNLLSNASWSGTRVAGDSIKYNKGQYGCSKERIEKLGTEEKKPDIIIIYLGINDFLFCEPLGDWHEKPGTLEYGEMIDTFSEGYALMLKGIKEQYPEAEVMCCTLFPSIGQYVLPTNYTNLEGTSLGAYNYVIKEVANYFNYDVINLYDCGINVNTMKQYTIDGLTHPNVAGMKIIRAKMIAELDKIYIRKYK